MGPIVCAETSVTKTLHRVTFAICEGLKYTEAEAWNLAIIKPLKLKFTGNSIQWSIRGSCRCRMHTGGRCAFCRPSADMTVANILPPSGFEPDIRRATSGRTTLITRTCLCVLSCVRKSLLMKKHAPPTEGIQHNNQQITWQPVLRPLKWRKIHAFRPLAVSCTNNGRRSTDWSLPIQFWFCSFVVHPTLTLWPKC
jgi:hypothetical protein